MSRKAWVTTMVASFTVLTWMHISPALTSAAGVTAGQVVPTITTQTTPANSAASGTSVYDTATVTGAAGGPVPTGIVTFTRYFDAPGAARCSGPSSGAQRPKSLIPFNATSAQATSESVTAPDTPGTFRFTVTYDGDPNYAAAGPTACSDPNESVVVTVVPTPPIPLLGDFDGDGLTDIAVWRPGNGTWYVKGISETVWGQGGDVPVPADYAGDGRTEFAVWRPGNSTWYIRGVSETVWGQAGDVPVPADYNGDGKADIAVFRPSNGTWYVKGISETVWGQAGDIPVPADYAGDARADIAVYRPDNGTWYIRGISETVWGQPGDIPVPADYAGDTKADIAVFRPSNGTWYVRGISETHFGLPPDVPVPGHYAPGSTDIAVWRPSDGTWYVRGISETVWGTANDVPV